MKFVQRMNGTWVRWLALGMMAQALASCGCASDQTRDEEVCRYDNSSGQPYLPRLM